MFSAYMLGSLCAVHIQFPTCRHYHSFNWPGSVKFLHLRLGLPRANPCSAIFWRQMYTLLFCDNSVRKPACTAGMSIMCHLLCSFVDVLLFVCVRQRTRISCFTLTVIRHLMYGEIFICLQVFCCIWQNATIVVCISVTAGYMYVCT